jgi:hypothetical protein
MVVLAATGDTSNSTPYADDLILFVSPSARDLQLTHSILSLFEDAWPATLTNVRWHPYGVRRNTWLWQWLNSHVK